LRRFLLGCPPRKNDDTSIGDAINWKWIILLCRTAQAGIIIVSRDSDYGAVFENRAYLNDHLKQEFNERVSRKRTITLYAKLSDALKIFGFGDTKGEKKKRTF
jgi:hypothetical protein